MYTDLSFWGQKRIFRRGGPAPSSTPQPCQRLRRLAPPYWNPKYATARSYGYFRITVICQVTWLAWDRHIISSTFWSYELSVLTEHADCSHAIRSSHDLETACQLMDTLGLHTVPGLADAFTQNGTWRDLWPDN